MIFKALVVDTRNIFESFEEKDLDFFFFFAFLMENSVMVITLGISFILIQKLSLFRLGSGRFLPRSFL